MFNSFASGGSSYAWLTPGGYIWANLCRSAHLHKRIAEDFGMRFEIAAYIWVHGHSNAGATETEYLGYLEEQEAALAQLRTDLGQTTRPVFCTTGTATSKFGGTTRSEVPRRRPSCRRGYSRAPSTPSRSASTAPIRRRRATRTTAT